MPLYAAGSSLLNIKYDRKQMIGAHYHTVWWTLLTSALLCHLNVGGPTGNQTLTVLTVLMPCSAHDLIDVVFQCLYPHSAFLNHSGKGHKWCICVNECNMKIFLTWVHTDT